MDVFRDIEIQVLIDVIDAVDDRLAKRARAGHPITAPRSQIYAVIIQAVIASARDTGHFGAGGLAHATLLDAIFSGVDQDGSDTAYYNQLLDQPALG